MTALPTYNESETVLSGVIVYGWRKYVFERSFRTTFSPSKPARKQAENGIPVQHLQYLPFGERFVDEHTSYQERFTFTGKETDCETGYSYFGARYYDPTLLTSWTAVDPMSDKYPSLSPYNYCAWNPIKLVDPDGRIIDSASITRQEIWNMVNPNHDCYNAEFACVFDQLAADQSTIFSFVEWNTPKVANNSIVKGNFVMTESNLNQLDKSTIGFFWGEDGTGIAPERYLFEEVYHAKQFLDGQFGFGRTSSDGVWNTMGMDLLDEEMAHKWADRVSGSTDSWTQDAINYYQDIKKLPTGSRNVTDHWLKYDGCVRNTPPKYDANGVFKDCYRTIRKPVSL